MTGSHWPRGKSVSRFLEDWGGMDQTTIGSASLGQVVKTKQQKQEQNKTNPRFSIQFTPVWDFISLFQAWN